MVPVVRDGNSVSSPSALTHVIPATSKRILQYRLGILGALAIATVLVSWKILFPNPELQRIPRVLRFTKLTNDRQLKWYSDSLASDGSRIYFTEMLPGQRTLILQVPVTGGEAVPLPISLERPRMLDLSRNGSELLVASEHDSLWAQPVTGGSARRVGTIAAIDARFGPDGTSIIYTDINEHDVYSVNRDGSSPRKLFTLSGLSNSFQFSPDGRRLRFTLFDRVLDNMTIMEGAPDGTGLHELRPGAWGRWTSDARFFIFQTRHSRRLDLWALPEQRHLLRQKSIEQPIQLTAGPMDFFQPLPSKDGKQIFAVGKTLQAEVVRYDAHTNEFVPYLSGISAVWLSQGMVNG